MGNDINGVVIKSTGIKSPQDIKLSDDEIVLSYELYTRMFNGNSKWFYINEDLTALRKIPEYIDSYCNISFSDFESKSKIGDIGACKIVGVGLSTGDFIDPEDNFRFLVNYSIVLETCQYLEKKQFNFTQNRFRFKSVCFFN